MLIGFHLTSLARGTAGGGGEIAPPGIRAFVSGDTNGVFDVNQTLLGTVTGGTSGQVVTHRWLADGVAITGETTDSFTLQPGGPVTLGASVTYAPLVDGQTYLSASIRFLPDITVSIAGGFSGNAVPGIELTGVITDLTPDQFVIHRWTANGQEIDQATRATYTPQLSTLQPGDMIAYAPIVEGLSFVSQDLTLSDQVTASLSGGVDAQIVVGDSLTGSISGGFVGQEVVHQWSADGAVIAGAIGPSYVPTVGAGVLIGSVLRYTPRVSGVSYTTDGVTLAAAVAVAVTGDTQGVIIPGETLTGTITGGYTAQEIVHRWSADGAILSGQSGPSLTLTPALGLLQGAVLRYAPLVGGQAYSSAPVTLGGMDQSSWVFADIGEDTARLISSPTPPPAPQASQITENSAFFEGL